MRIAADGKMLEVRRASDGVFTGRGDFAVRLGAHLGDWVIDAPSSPIMLCGMIGSDRGWRHASYVQAPTDVMGLARALTPVPFKGVAKIVPGVTASYSNEMEVMRGEETLVLGFLAQTEISDAVLCLPGTHSKWVRVRQGRIDHFRTYMTGELRALVLAQGALATGAVQVPSQDAFLRGMRSEGSAMSRRLFQARSRRLLGALAIEHTASFVSGVVIGEEVAAEVRSVESGTPIFLVARDELAKDYAFALKHAGVVHTIVEPEPLAALGLLRIARQAGLIAR